MSRVFLPLLITVLLSCGTAPDESAPIQIAFLADVHLTNIYGELADSDFKGIQNLSNGEYVLARTMASQLRSTRIFNENYFAFLTALDDIAQRGIKLVAFPGDYTDDGQPLHVRGLREILETYEENYGMTFMITTGNHDPVRPFYNDAGKRDFLGEGGKNQPIFSKQGMYKSNPQKDHPPIISSDLAEMGYQEILDELGPFGFMPNKNYVYWSTPFSDLPMEEYTYQKAVEWSALENRKYEVAPGFKVPDVTYLVEPVEGIWLMAIDGNIYVPRDETGDINDPRSYGSPSVGYNNMSDNKQYLLDWVSKIADEAEAKKKSLIAFTHYPIVDFNDDASPLLKKLLGENKWQLARVPEERIAQSFADAGIRIHVAGHMHINDTGVRISDKGNPVVNIQTPSLAAYQPGYKILTIHPNERVEVETVTIDSVPRFKELFPLYEMEYAFLEENGEEYIWDKEILKVESYHDFMLWHLKELVRLRFIRDWPEPIKSAMTEGSVATLVEGLEVELSDQQKAVSAYDVLIDFYKIRNADQLAFNDISEEQLQLYQKIIAAYKKAEPKDELSIQLKEFFDILDHFLNGQPADHFLIDLEKGALEDY